MSQAGEHIFLAGFGANPKPGPYAGAIAAAQEAGTEYWGIWNILAFHPMASYYLCQFSHELMFKEASFSAPLHDPENSALSEKEEALLRPVRKFTLDSGSIAQDDTIALQSSGWDAASIYYTIGACAWFNSYHRFVSGNGGKLVSEDTFNRLGERMAKAGYSREQPPLERTA